MRILGYNPQVAVQIAVAENVALFHQTNVILQNALRTGHVARFPFDLQGIVQKAGADVQGGFKKPDILVAGSEQGFNPAADLH